MVGVWMLRQVEIVTEWKTMPQHIVAFDFFRLIDLHHICPKYNEPTKT